VPRLARRIYGLENEYGITCTQRGQRRLSPDEVARYLFRRVVSWGRSSNVFLENGARLYLDVGSHPEYATPECDSLLDLVAHDKAGERILDSLAHSAEVRMHEEGIRGSVFLLKNNTDSAGNSYGCHENYLTVRVDDLTRLVEVLIPFLVSRQVIAGAGKVLLTSRGPLYAISQRAEHIWEGVSSATTRSRPIINTRDEPHADAERYRRLHVIVGDSNMAQWATYLKVGTMAIVLRLLEEEVVLRDVTLENPIRAIREIAHDTELVRRVRLVNGRELTGLELQEAYLERAQRYHDRIGLPADEARALEMWAEAIKALRAGDREALFGKVDWVTKLTLIDAYRERHRLPLSHPQVSLLDLQYHDISRERGLFARLEASGRVPRLVDDEVIERAVDEPPRTTRANLRGRFIRAAKEAHRDYTVDWVHLKLNDQAQRTVMLKDPFAAEDERVDRLLASM